jgi:hypothetical protein
MSARIEWLTDRPLRIHILGGLLTLTVLAALGGGALLLADRTGSLLGLSIAQLSGTPFPDYTIPGAVLVTLFGLLPIPVLMGLWRERTWARDLAGVLGVGLVVWITVQVAWLGLVSPLQPVVWAEGLVLLTVAGAPAWQRGRS